MKKIISLVIILLFGFEVLAQKHREITLRDKTLPETQDSIRILEKKLGITDLLLKSPKSKFPNLEFVRNAGKCNKLYKRKNETYKLGDYEVRSVQFEFDLNNKLSGIYIDFKNRNDFYKVVQEIEKYYGLPIGPDISSADNTITDPGHYSLLTEKLNIHYFENELSFIFGASKIVECN